MQNESKIPAIQMSGEGFVQTDIPLSKEKPLHPTAKIYQYHLIQETRAKRIVLDLHCGWSMFTTDGKIFMNEYGCLRDLSATGFSIITDRNIDLDMIDYICVTIAKKRQIIPVAGKAVRKVRRNDGTFKYGCQLLGRNSNLEHFLEVYLRHSNCCNLQKFTFNYQ